MNSESEIVQKYMRQQRFQFRVEIRRTNLNLLLNKKREMLIREMEKKNPNKYRNFYIKFFLLHKFLTTVKHSGDPNQRCTRKMYRKNRL